MPVKHSTTLRRELERVRSQLRRKDLDAWYRGVMYGAQQTLSWTLGRDACAPTHITPPTGRQSGG